MLSFSEIIQIDLIWTILQPITHRDLYYAAKIDDPDYNYKKLSTPITRAFVYLYLYIFWFCIKNKFPFFNLKKEKEKDLSTGK